MGPRAVGGVTGAQVGPCGGRLVDNAPDHAVLVAPAGAAPESPRKPPVVAATMVESAAWRLDEVLPAAGAFAPAGFVSSSCSSSSPSRACPASAVAADAVAILAGAVLANFRHRLADDVGGMKGCLAQRAAAGEAGGADAGHCGGGWRAQTGLRMVCVPRSATGFSKNV